MSRADEIRCEMEARMNAGMNENEAFNSVIGEDAAILSIADMLYEQTYGGK